MATAPLSPGQMKDLFTAMVQAIPKDLPYHVAEKWISRKGELGNRIREILLEDSRSVLPDIDWPKTYESLGMSEEYSMFPAVKEDPSFWTVPAISGVTCKKAVEALKDAGVDVYLYINDLDRDVHTNDRDPNSDSYAISFKRTIEADEENKNLSANMLKDRGHQGITLLERLLLELGYFLTTGKHLDEKNLTLCSGSRYSDGSVPDVRWFSDCRLVYVSWYNPDNRYDRLRSRSAVSLSGNPKD